MSDAARNRTIVSLFSEQVSTHRDRPALHVKRNGQYQALTWRQVVRDVRRLASLIVSLGVGPGDRVAQLSENRYEWIITDLAVQLAQAVHVPIHAPLAGEQVAQQVSDSGSRLLFISTSDQLAKVAKAIECFASEVRYVSFDRCDTPQEDSRVDCLRDLIESASESAGEELEKQALESLTPDSLATILYTSGTTGEPKGVMLNQRNIVSNSVGTVEAFGHLPDDLRLTFLPLSHIFARTCDLYTWIAAGSQLALAESRDTVFADCAAVRPTLLNGVPYFYQLVQRYLVDEGRADEPESLRELLGGRIRACGSGGAALPDHIFDFFHERNVPLLQGYGLTESSPVISLSSLDAFKRGKVGRPLAGVEVRIAEDGEILTRGPHVMVGFWNNPSATDEVIKDGWLYTGDIGTMDDEGFLAITGRKKELIVTAAGKNVAPVYLESLLCRDPLIEQAVVIGDGRSYLTALIVPNADNLREEISARRLFVWNKRRALTHPNVLELYQQRIEQQLAGVSHHEQVRRFTLLDRGFTIESGEMTPKLSLRRQVIEANFGREIESMYEKR